MAYCFVERHVNVPGTMWCECGSLVAGTPIDGYNVISYIGHGTSGDVYLAEQPSLNNRKVVVKIAHRSWHQSDIDNFRREAALLASLSHPYILPIYAYGVIYERQSPVFTYSPYLVLPYAEQGSLEEAFTRSGKRPWPLMRVVSMAQEIADALEYAHSRGVLHRDVKPANLLQMGSHALLSDFSVASLIDADESHLNAPWAGSPAYMAPEVWKHSPGRYSDQYALAVTCFRLLAGDYPWAKMSEGSVQEWSHLHRYVTPRSLQENRPNLPRAVDLVLQRGMAKDPHERYPTVQAFAADLLDASEDKTQGLDKPAKDVQLRPLLLDVQTAGKGWQNTSVPDVEVGQPNASPVITASTPGLPLSSPRRGSPGAINRGAAQPAASPVIAASRAGLAPAPTNHRPAHPVVSPVTAATQPVTEGIHESIGPSAELAVGVPLAGTLSISSRPAPMYRPNVGSDPLAGSQRNNRWIWYALVLNVLICVLLAAEAYWQSKDIMSGVHLFQALWPSLLVGPLLARWFRSIRLTTFSWGIFWGVFFGMTNVLLSGAACYLVVVLAQTITQWGHDWRYAGDGLRIFKDQVVGLAQFVLKPMLLGLWLSVLGGAFMGIFLYKNERAR